MKPSATAGTSTVTLTPLTQADREQFILDNQEAFRYGALEEFGRRDDHFEEEGEIISRATIEQAIDRGEAYRILQGGEWVEWCCTWMAHGGIWTCCLSHLAATARASACRMAGRGKPPPGGGGLGDSDPIF